MTRRRLILLPTFLLCVIAVASEGWALSLELGRVADLNTPIPDGSGNFTAFGLFPALSGDNVAFLGNGSSGLFGIYLSANSVLSRVADNKTPIPDGSGLFSNLDFFPELSGDNVAFRGFGSGQEGIYLFSGAVLSRVADTATPIPGRSRNFTGFGSPALSGDNVAFSGDGGDYLFSGGVLSRVADLNTPIPNGSGNFTQIGPPAISGDVVGFMAFGSSGQQGLYLFENGVLSRVADLNIPIPGGTGTFTGLMFGAFNGDNWTFWGSGSSGQQGIYLFSGGVLRLVANLNTPIPAGTGTFTFHLPFQPPIFGLAVSGNVVAFEAFGSSGQHGIYLFENGLLSRVADLNTPIPNGSGNFTEIDTLSLRLSGGNVAFKGIGSSGQQGIYLFRGGLLERVVDLNTPIPGGSGNFTSVSISDLSGDNVAFWGYGPSQSGIYLATPVPAEPGLALALSPNRPAFRGSDTLHLDLTFENSGGATNVDAYFAILLPAAAGPDFGCPSGDAIVFVTDSFAQFVTTCLSAPTANFAPFVSKVPIAASIPATLVKDFFTVVWPPTAPAGTYTFVLALTAPGTLDVISLAQTTVSFSP